jgi:rubrerythrin
MSITLAQAIRNAIAAEKSAEQFYLRLARRCVNQTGRAILSDIAIQERHHAETLESLAVQMDAGQLPEYADSLVHGIETAPAGEAKGDLDYAEALDLAIEAEDSAVLYYEALAATASGDASLFFARMGKEEALHAAAIRALREKIGNG